MAQFFLVTPPPPNQKIKQGLVEGFELPPNYNTLASRLFSRLSRTTLRLSETELAVLRPVQQRPVQQSTVNVRFERMWWEHRCVSLIGVFLGTRWTHSSRAALCPPHCPPRSCSPRWAPSPPGSACRPSRLIKTTWNHVHMVKMKSSRNASLFKKEKPKPKTTSFILKAVGYIAVVWIYLDPNLNLNAAKHVR